MSSNYAPPWFDAETGEEYGPKTIATYQRHMSQFKDWSFRKQGPERLEAQLIHCYVAKHHESVPESEMEVYRLLYVRRLSLRDAASESGWSRSTVRSYVKRLRVRAEAWRSTLDTDRRNCQK